LLLNLRDKLGAKPAETTNGEKPAVESLNAIMEILHADVLAARDRLLMLNPSRREMIESRLEVIARRIAHSRGEKFARRPSLPDILKDSYRDGGNPTLSQAAWKGFVSEVAAFHMLELFFLKCLEVFGWRRFEPADLGRMNFAANTFLAGRAAGFAHDKHCWNFVRTNLYSWHVLSAKALTEISRVLSQMSFSWSDRELRAWIRQLPPHLRLPHLDFAADERAARLAVDLVERELGQPLTMAFQGRVLCRKFFVPSLELARRGARDPRPATRAHSPRGPRRLRRRRAR
jgi:hypothetical protein